MKPLPCVKHKGVNLSERLIRGQSVLEQNYPYFDCQTRTSSRASAHLLGFVYAETVRKRQALVCHGTHGQEWAGNGAGRSMCSLRCGELACHRCAASAAKPLAVGLPACACSVEGRIAVSLIFASTINLDSPRIESARHGFETKGKSTGIFLTCSNASASLPET